MDENQYPKTCCGMAMSTLEVFGVRLYQCVYRSHHPLIFRNLNTGEERMEKYDPSDPDDRLEWDTSNFEDE